MGWEDYILDLIPSYNKRIAKVGGWAAHRFDMLNASLSKPVVDTVLLGWIYTPGFIPL